MFFLSHQYRSPVDFSDEAVGATRKNLDYFYNTLLRIEEVCGRQVADPAARDWDGEARKVLEGMEDDFAGPLMNLRENFCRALNDDFNTADALGELFRAAAVLNRWIDGSDRTGSVQGRTVLESFRRQLGEIGQVLGLFQENPLGWFRQGSGLRAPADVLSDEAIEERVQAREGARRAKDWKASDRIRAELAEQGVVLEDTPQGTRWKRRD